MSAKINRKIIVFGGNGFVGSHVCKEALKRGLVVTSVNRSGKPHVGEEWVNKVEWVAGDVFRPESYRSAFNDATGAVSCIGGFGTTEAMEMVNGDANIIAAKEAKDAGIKNFSYISEAHVRLEYSKWFPLYGYMDGKRRAEDNIKELFPTSHYFIRPSAISGTRRVGPVNVPLHLFLKPVEFFTSFSFVQGWAKCGYLGLVLDTPVNVTEVARAAVSGALGEIEAGVIDIQALRSQSYIKNTK